jgi:hypothetical protein
MLDKEYALKDLTFPDNAVVEQWMESVRGKTGVTVKKA